MNPILDPRCESLGRRRVTLLAVALGALVAIVYFPTLDHQFVNLDDPMYISDNADVTAPSWDGLILTVTEVLHPSRVAGYYQPLTIASLMLDRVVDLAINGGTTERPPDPRVFHAFGIFFHCVNVALLFGLLHHLLAGAGLGGGLRAVAAAAGAMWFGLHPVNVEVVSWVCQRKALLGFGLVVGSIWAWDAFRSTGRGSCFVVAFFCFALSMLTKPTSCLLPPALLVFDYWRRRDWNAESIVAWAALFAAAAVGGAIAFVSQRNSLGEAPLDALTDRIDTIIVICHNIVFYLRLFVAPVSLSTHHPIPFEITLSDPAMLAGVIGTFAVGVSLVTAWRLNRRGWLFGLIGFLILLAPVLGAVRFMSEIAADRFLYLPMLPILMAIVTWAGFKLGRLRAAGRGVTPLSGRVGLGAAVLMLALFTLKTLTQQSAWRDSFAFWNAAIAYQADVSSSIFGLGTAYMERAESRLKAARALDGQDAPDSVKTTTAYQRDIDDALRLFQRALELPGYDARAAMEIAAIYADRGQFQEALDLLAENVPENSVTRREFALKGFILTNLGRHEEAIAAYERFLRLRPRDPGVLLNLGNALLRVGRIEEAERRLESRVEMDRNDVDDGRAWYTLGLARLRLRGDAAAIEPLEHAVRLCPGNADFQFALSARYAGVGRDREALGALAVAIRRDASKADIARKAPQFERLRGTTAWRGLIPEQPRDGT